MSNRSRELPVRAVDRDLVDDEESVQGGGEEDYVPPRNYRGPQRNAPRPAVYRREAVYENRRTMKEMSAPTFDPQPWCIQIDEDEDTFELSSGVIHHLPKFHGLEDENPTEHLKEFHVICVTMKPHGVAEETFKLKAFPFSLTGNAKSWLMTIPAGSIRSWEQMQRKFLNKYFPPSKAAQIRKELAGIHQFRGEPLYEYLERFQQLTNSCHNLGVPERLLIEYFLDGMIPMERRMLDAAARGSVMNLYPEEVWDLIHNTAENSRYFENPNKPRNISNVESSDLQEVKDLLAQLVVTHKKPKVCGICSAPDHITSACPQPPEDEGVNAIGFQNQNQQRRGEGNWRSNNNNNYSRPFNPQQQDRGPYVPPHRH